MAIASVTSLREENRRQAIESKVLDRIIQCLSNPDPKIKSAACQCTRSLSRSVKNLRTHLVDAGVVLPLIKLLSDSNEQVLISATATICNIVLDFSPMKKTFLENHGISSLVSMLSKENSNLRLNALWALKNLLFQADSDIKVQVLNQLGRELILELCQDPSFVIQEQILNLIRNSACGKEQDIDFVIQSLGSVSLMDMIESKLCLLGIPDEIYLHVSFFLSIFNNYN